MRKARVRALKLAFEERFGRPPNGVVVGQELPDKPGLIPYVPSEKRRIRKLLLEARRA